MPQEMQWWKAKTLGIIDSLCPIGMAILIDPDIKVIKSKTKKGRNILKRLPIR